MTLEFWGLVAGGLLVGTFGTLIGAGGGFILAPVLLLVYPHDPPETIASMSLAVTFVNACSGSVAYARMKRINYRYGLIFAAAGVPGAILGALTTHLVPRREFDGLFALVLLAAAAWLLLKPPATRDEHAEHPLHLSRRQLGQGIGISLGVGFVSSLLGIGGGIIHVPALVGLLAFPVHVATATSHFVLALTAGTGVAAHALSGGMQHGLRRVACLAAGVLVGAQLGARWSTRVHGPLIIRALAVGLGLVGLRLLYQACV